MKLKFLFVLAIIATTFKFNAQVYAASNMTLLSTISPEAGVGIKYSGCWGWTQPGTGREYAIACSKNGTYWIDVTNPATPTVSAYKAGTSSNGSWRETKTYGNYCYVVCDDGGSTGFQIFDMSTLPATVTLVSSNQTLFRRGHACWVDGNKLYVSGVTYSTGASPASSSMDVYSLATPSAPMLLRRLSQDYPSITYVHDEFVRNDTVFASCGNQGLYVFKFNNGINTFTQLGSLVTYTASGYNHASALTPNGQTLVFMDEVPAALPIKVANVSNLANITVLATCNQYTQTTPHNPFMVTNQYCFASSYRDGTQLWDISNPNAPFLAGFFDTHPQTGGNNNNWTGSAYDGQWGMYPYLPSKTIFALDRQNGLFVLGTHLFANPEVDVTGNAISITDGAVVTNTTNNTNFGTVNVGNNLSNTFVIQNSGFGTLSVTSMSMTGANASEFTFVGATSFTVAASSSQSFTVQFTPIAAGSRTAMLTINNNDLNEGSYDFVVEGTGNIVSGINNLSDAGFDFAVFPNPAKNEIQFNIPANLNDKELQLKIYDSNGKLVSEKQNIEIIKNGNASRKVQLGELSNGIYQISFISDKKTIASKKLVISK